MYNIAIDTSPLSDGNSVRGVGFYTKNIINALKTEILTNTEYKNYQIDLVTSKDLLKNNNYNLIHYPFFDPFNLTLPVSNTIPFIISIHDLIPRQFKDKYPVGIKGEIKWLIQKHRAQKAKYIITDSHYSKYIIAKQLNYPVDKIYVTHLAAEEIFRPINKKSLSKIKIKYNLPDKFVLYVGDINWNKNIPNLALACQELNIPLIIVGAAAVSNAPQHPWTRDIHWLQNFCKTNKNIKCIGFVDDNDRPAIYNLATIYCQPSYAEGFGLPVVEAMQSGTPVLYSIETSLSEIMDYNGEFFDPYKPDDLKNKLKNLLNNQKLQKQYSKLGLKRAKIFNWKYTAIQTLSVYKLALEYDQ